MAQEQFAGPDHYTEFDPEKFVRDLKVQRRKSCERERCRWHRRHRRERRF